MDRYSGGLRYGVAMGVLVLAMTASQAGAQQQQPSQAADGPVVLDTITVQGESIAGAPLVTGPTTTRTTREELDRQQIQSISELANRYEAGIGFNRNNNSI